MLPEMNMLRFSLGVMKMDIGSEINTSEELLILDVSEIK